MMGVKRTVIVGLVGAIVVCGGATVVLAHPWLGKGDIVARGQERPPVAVAHRQLAQPRRSRQLRPAVVVKPILHRRSPGAASPRPRLPNAPVALLQTGGLEPAMRPIAPGAWLNTRGFTLTMRMSSPMATTRLQPQVEVQPANKPFTGFPTSVGTTLTYRGKALTGSIEIGGLRDGVAYHWRARVYDTHGLASPWTALPHNTLRVHLGAPAAPALALETPARPGNWVGTRRLTLQWSEAPDVSGIRGYSYTLARSATYDPLMHWRTWLPGVTIRANGEGTWYFSVRALNNAHTWGPVTRIPIHIDTAAPRLRVLSAPAPTRFVDPLHTRPLLRLGLTQWSGTTVDVLTAHGQVVRTILTSVHGPGYDLRINWDGRDAQGKVVGNGPYTLRVTAVNRAGVRWSMTRPLQVMTGAPQFTDYGLSQTYSYNPYNNSIDGPENITATLDGPTASVRVEAIHGNTVERAWTLTGVQAGAVITATWDGHAADGADLPSGSYTFQATAVAPTGDKRTATLGSVDLDLRRIVVSLKKQKLWALDGNRVLLSTLVTTGGPDLPTPTGDFQIIDRESPFTFHSPFPPGSPYWYADSPTNFAMLFQIDGYFIHDAPWRTFYGPGSNVVSGTPGQNTTGTHGCVNVPYQAMAWLYNWTPMYTPVQVRDDVSLN